MLSNRKNKDIAKETFYGYIENTKDSLLIFEACKRGIIPRISRRLQDNERCLIRSGSIFCFDEQESGIKRWTDGLNWSPSRILGNFLIYREMDSRKNGRNSSIDEYGVMQNGMRNIGNIISRSHSLSLSSTTSEQLLAQGWIRNRREKAILGSLKNSSKFKRNGLIKKSMSLLVDGVQQHIVSYYNKDDVLSNRLKTPSSIVELSSLTVSPGLRLRQNFRIPIFSSEEISDDRFMDDFQALNNDAKRKYSDMTRHSLPDISSSPSSYSSHSSTSIHGFESAYLLSADGQSSQHQSQFYPTDPSINSLIDVQAPPTIDVDNSQAILKANMDSNVQQISSDVHSSINNNIQQHVSFHESSHLHEVSTISRSGFDNIIQPKSLPCEETFKRKKMNLHHKDFGGNNLVVTSGTLLESQSSEHNSGMATCNNVVQSDNELKRPSENNITTAQSFSNVNRKANRTVQLPPASSYNCGMSLDFNSESIVNVDSVHNYLNPRGSYNSPVHASDYLQEQNPHQHLFSSSSFHAINYAAIPHRAEIAANSFMLDMNDLLGTGWNEFELQM